MGFAKKTTRTALVAGLILGGSTPSYADAFTPAMIRNIQAEGQSKGMDGIRGVCTKESHIAAGPVGTDLTHSHIPFRCNAAILVFFDPRNQHVMVNFAEKELTHDIISFSGTMDRDGIILSVSKVYFEPGTPTYVDDGACKFFFSGHHMKSIFCGAKIDADGQRTVASISFEAEPGQ